jgi:hypothetical protein
MRKEELGESDPVAARIFLLIQALSGGLVQRIPRPARLLPFYPSRRDQMSEIVIEVKRFGGCTDMRNGTTAIEFAIGNELNPKADGIVVQADETDIALIKLRRVEATSISSKV